MPQRSYGQFCGAARALDLVGERWAFLVVRELILGPRRFTDLQSGLPGIATNVLTSRLKELESDGIVHRRMLPPPASSTVYELTEYGRELEDILLALGRWGAMSLGQPSPDRVLRSGWIGVACRAYCRSESTVGVRATIELRLDDGVFHVVLDDGRVEVRDGHAADPDLLVETANESLLGLLSGGIDAAELSETGAMRLDGEEALLPTLVAALPFPRLD